MDVAGSSQQTATVLYKECCGFGFSSRRFASVTCNYLNSSKPTFDIHCEAVKPLSGQVCTINTRMIYTYILYILNIYFYIFYIFIIYLYIFILYIYIF